MPVAFFRFTVLPQWITTSLLGYFEVDVQKMTCCQETNPQIGHKTKKEIIFWWHLWLNKAEDESRLTGPYPYFNFCLRICNMICIQSTPGCNCYQSFPLLNIHGHEYLKEIILEFSVSMSFIYPWDRHCESCQSFFLHSQWILAPVFCWCNNSQCKRSESVASKSWLSSSKQWCWSSGAQSVTANPVRKEHTGPRCIHAAMSESLLNWAQTTSSVQVCWTLWVNIWCRAGRPSHCLDSINVWDGERVQSDVDERRLTADRPPSEPFIHALSGIWI